MAIMENVLNYIGLVTTTQLETRLTEAQAQANRAYESGFYDGLFDGEDEPPSGDIATFGYRRHAPRGLRDFSALTHDQIINTVWTLYQSNGVAKRGLTLKRDHILGRNVKPVVEGDTDLQEILGRFWGTNKLKKRLKKFLVDHSLFGELCLPVFVRATDGRVKLGYVDPAEIEDVLTHPHNILEQWMVVTKIRGGKRRIYRIIREDEGFVRQNRVVPPRHPDRLVTHEQAVLEPWEEGFLQANGMNAYTGSCFYFDKNNVSNQPRGFSDLLQSADMLDQHDETLFSLGEREALASYFSWDVALKGSKEEVQARASELRRAPPVKRGQINAHNESEIWTMNTADLRQPGTIATAQALKTQALEGLNQPRHWHGEDDTANRSTAESADNPTTKALESEQDDIKSMLMEISTFVRDQAQIAGMWQPSADMTGDIDIQMPEITRKDMTKVAAVLTQVVQAVTVAHLDLKVITRETVAAAVAKILAELGIDYDATEEIELIDSQDADGEMFAANTTNQILSTMINGSANGSANDERA